MEAPFSINAIESEKGAKEKKGVVEEYQRLISYYDPGGDREIERNAELRSPLLSSGDREANHDRGYEV
ncbi:hypothetical protein TIFTF001_028693 [Ficus carica]|uniref:Uncharacterized protein n=1 Tax=Ficus carica TaxID=3494 RepID=A0AA88J1G5_FICCA|nr:hypothetical protein TIFTF001_028693 [Ficus carica]